ncbi:MAG: hypothetical protein HY705_01430 [Gemmatimonadetes bacterium]|nr:hypothetical protein [Gemmatimonadota bacterium]
MRVLRWLVPASLAAVVAGCPGENTGPVGGELVVSLDGPASSSRAIMFRLVGAQTAVTAPTGSGYSIFTAGLGGDTARVAVVGPSGSGLAVGPLVRLAVPDVRRVSAYAATVSEVVAHSYTLLTPTFFVLKVVKP